MIGANLVSAIALLRENGYPVEAGHQPGRSVSKFTIEHGDMIIADLWGSMGTDEKLVHFTGTIVRGGSGRRRQQHLTTHYVSSRFSNNI